MCLAQEHRCPGAQDDKGSCPGPVTDWINEMACYIKGLGAQFLVRTSHVLRSLVFCAPSGFCALSGFLCAL